MDVTTFLLPTALKGLALSGIVVACCPVLRRAPGAVLHAVLAVMFGSLVALPILQVAGPVWRVSVATEQTSTKNAIPYETLPGSARSGEDASVGAATPASRSEFADVAPTPTSRAASGAVTLATPFVAPPGSEEASAPDWTAAPRASQGASWTWLALCAWGTGALLVALYCALALASAARLVRAARSVTDEDWLETLARAQQSLGHAGAVRLLRSDQVSTPFAWGLGSPAVVLPLSSGAWDADARASVLEHEVAHLARRDPHVQIVVQVALALHWFNPLVWVAYRRMLLARERACDDAALAAGAAPSAYAGLLLSVARLAHTPTAPYMREQVVLSAVPSMARPSDLESRIVSVLDPNARRGAVSRGIRVALGLGVLAALLPLAAFRPVADEAAAAPTGTGGSRAEAVSSLVARPSAATASVEATAMPARFDAPLLRGRDAPAIASNESARTPLPSPSTGLPLFSPLGLPLRPQSPPVPPAPPAPPSPEPAPARPWGNVGRDIEPVEGVEVRRQEVVRASPTPGAIPPGALPAPERAGSVDWDAVTAARLAAEAVLRQRLD